MKNLKILVTNDDNHDSPLLHFLLEKLRHDNELTIVAPAEEKSWTGKGVSCVGTRAVETSEIDGLKSYFIDGLPADCSNIGIYHLCETRPDVLFSGINAGRNLGAAFIMTSGTVGACLEANIAGIPAVAFSQELAPEVMKRWSVSRSFSSEIYQRLEINVSAAMDRLFPFLLSQSNFLKEPVTWNVNFPWDFSEETEIRLCDVNPSTYGSCFTPGVLGYSHALDAEGIKLGERQDTDAHLLAAGFLTVSIIDYRLIGVRPKT